MKHLSNFLSLFDSVYMLRTRQNNLNVRSFNFIAISTQIRTNFSTIAGMCDFQLSFGEANFTRRNDITSENVLNRPICDEMIK